MKGIATGAAIAFVALLFGTFGFIGFVVVVAGGAGTASTAVTISDPSTEAIEDIPRLLLHLFIAEAQQCSGMPWTVIAGISKVESDHSRFRGATIHADGTVRPSIIGIALDGTSGTARVRDSDDGRWDGDIVWDRAVGPFQFLPSSWRIFGGDGNNDGIADPNNVFDAVPAVRRHLCPDGQIVDLEVAILSYNHSTVYVTTVLEWARRYSGPLTAAALPIAGYALPIPEAFANEPLLARAHGGSAASDLALPVGTPVFAMVSGTVTAATTAGVFPNDPTRCGSTIIIIGIDGASYTYCHLSVLAVAPGQVVGPGTAIGLSGGRHGAPGAGNTTGPHLHLGIRFGDVAVCPQPLLLAIHRRQPINPAIAPVAGCVQGRPGTDWTAWLDLIGLEPRPDGDSP